MLPKIAQIGLSILLVLTLIALPTEARSIVDKQSHVQNEVHQLLNVLGLADQNSDAYKTLKPHLEAALSCDGSIPMSQDVEFSLSCSTCKFVIGLVRTLLAKNKTMDEIAAEIINACVSLNLATEKLCRGVIGLIKDQLGYILTTSPLTVADLCGLYVGGDCLTKETADKVRWNFTLPPTPKPPTHDILPPPADAPKLRVLHITDIHYDPLYVVGSLGACPDPLCCQAGSGDVTSPDQAAGVWGDYRNCDSPLWTVDNMLEHIRDNHQDIDYVVWTGDVPSHAIWKHTQEELIESSTQMNWLIRKYFPDKVVYPSAGNHETVPVNSFPPPEISDVFSMDWMYRPLTDDWMKWLPNETYDTVRMGAFYSTLIRPGFRIISLNTNYGYIENWFNLLNIVDPAKMLQFLVDELDRAEQNGEKVHMIGHVPTSHSFTSPWQEVIHKILLRYESTIVANFYGHTHDDDVYVHFDPDDTSRPIRVEYAAPSVTTASYLNPAFRIYTIDGDWENSTRAVLDFETYYFDLEETLTTGTPNWKLEYSAKTAYNLTQLEPKNWVDFVDRMRNDDSLVQDYYGNIHRWTSFFPHCDDSCKQGVINDILVTPPSQIYANLADKPSVKQCFH